MLSPAGGVGGGQFTLEMIQGNYKRIVIMINDPHHWRVYVSGFNRIDHWLY